MVYYSRFLSETYNVNSYLFIHGYCLCFRHGSGRGKSSKIPNVLAAEPMGELQLCGSHYPGTETPYETIATICVQTVHTFSNFCNGKGTVSKKSVKVVERFKF